MHREVLEAAMVWMQDSLTTHGVKFGSWHHSADDGAFVLGGNSLSHWTGLYVLSV